MKTLFTERNLPAGAPPPTDPIHPAAAAADTAARRGPHAVVIGSGFGGLAAAIRLGARGWRVTLLEKLDAPGGRAYTYRRDGYTFDAGPTIVTAPYLLDELWALCGRRFADEIRLQALDPFYRIRFDDGSHLDYGGDDAKLRAEIMRLAPADVAGFDAFRRVAEQCYRLGYEGMAETAFDRLRDLFAALPAMVRMRAWRSIYQLASEHLRDPRLRIALSFHPLLIGGNPLAVTSAYALITALERRFGVHWPVGGVGTLVSGLVRLAQGQGAQLRCNAEVRRILVDDRGRRPRATGVELAGGERIGADIVVSNGDTAWTYQRLVEPRHRRVWSERRIRRARYSMSLFVWYFGLRRQYPQVLQHTLLLGPRYDGLLRDIFKRHLLAADFSLYLHRPTANDPSMAPPGCDSFYVLSPVPHLDSGTDWQATAESYRRAIAQRLHETVLPGFEQHVAVSFVATPQDFHDRLLSYKGAAFGMEPILTQSAWFRPHNRSEDIERLYMVGAGTHPGAGIPGVLASAKAFESVLPPIEAFA